MDPEFQIDRDIKLDNGKLLIGLSGWMNGCEISTDATDYFIDKLDAQQASFIVPNGFYIHNFPGSMETTAMFRPGTKIKGGIVQSYDEPENIFYCDQKNNLLFLIGKEPNIRWHKYIECVFSICRQIGVKSIYFVGSVAGLVPHNREPRFFCSVSDKSLKPVMERRGVKFSDYEGPASIITYMTAMAHEAGLDMTSIIVEIPAYVQGKNPLCLNAVIKRMAGLFEIPIEHDEMEKMGEEFEKRVGRIVSEHPELANHVRRLEADYDNEVFNSEMGDLKKWLQQQGIRVD